MKKLLLIMAACVLGLRIAAAQTDEQPADTVPPDDGSKAVSSFEAEAFKADTDYKPDVLAQKINQGKRLKEQYPQQAESIDLYLKPWVERQENLAAGRVRFENGWKTRQEIAQILSSRNQEQMKEFLANNPGIHLDAVVANQTSVLVGAGVVAISLALTLYMLGYILFSGGESFRLWSMLVFVLGLALLTAYGYFGFKIFNGPARIEDCVDAKT